jgi:hypothetical protein
MLAQRRGLKLRAAVGFGAVMEQQAMTLQWMTLKEARWRCRWSGAAGCSSGGGADGAERRAAAAVVEVQMERSGGLQQPGGAGALLGGYQHESSRRLVPAKMYWNMWKLSHQ